MMDLLGHDFAMTVITCDLTALTCWAFLISRFRSIAGGTCCRSSSKVPKEPQWVHEVGAWGSPFVFGHATEEGTPRSVFHRRVVSESPGIEQLNATNTHTHTATYVYSFGVGGGGRG